MIHVSLLNAALDTGNLGVSALGYSVIAGLARRISDLKLTVFDNGFGIRSDTVSIDGSSFQFNRCGVRVSRRIYRPEAMWNIRLAAMLGGAGNYIARHLLKQDFALDITGGDSFTDLYGTKAFDTGNQVKSLFLDQQIPLGFLPQTYGPFQTAIHRAVAANLVQRAEFAWARDERSFSALRELLGSSFDSGRHHCGVDVAFLLEAVQPPDIGFPVIDWLSKPSRPIVGLNVSGLIYNDPKAAKHQYGFVANYRQVINVLVQRLLDRSNCNILLIPHVIVAPEHVESDTAACRDVYSQSEKMSNGRLAILPEMSDPRHVKWAISKCDWFCGTRMHATIAALSTGVPTAAVAYSLKTAGVFETCDQGEHVADPRVLPTAAMIDQLWSSWSSHGDARESLGSSLPSVLDRANWQMDLIAASCQGLAVPSIAGRGTE